MGRVQDTVNSIKSALKSVVSSPVASEAGLEDSLEREIARRKSEFETAKASHDVSLALADKADAALVAAKKAFADDPTADANGIALFRAEKVLAIVAEKVAATQAPLDRARNAVVTAELALASKAQDEALAARVADLRRRSSLDEFRNRNALNYSVIFEAFETIRRASLSVEADFNGTNQAAAELSELGESVPQLEMHHLAMPLLCLFVDSEQDQLKPIVDSCVRGYGAGILAQFAGGLSRTLCAPIDMVRQPGGTPMGQIGLHLDRLEALCAAPSLGQGMADASAILDPLEVAASAASNQFIAKMRANAAAVESARHPAEGKIVEV